MFQLKQEYRQECKDNIINQGVDLEIAKSKEDVIMEPMEYETEISHNTFEEASDSNFDFDRVSNASSEYDVDLVQDEDQPEDNLGDLLDSEPIYSYNMMLFRMPPVPFGSARLSSHHSLVSWKILFGKSMVSRLADA
uniref:Ovule protein n=1 Tax=Panagrellus redivivus TaxID=6233 RepID=A0A7E4UPK6_PANRE